MDPRRTFVVAAAAVLALAFALLVVRPAIERGGVQELLIVAAIFVVVLALERYLRTRG